MKMEPFGDPLAFKYAFLFYVLDSDINLAGNNARRSTADGAR